MVKNLPAMQEIRVYSLGHEDPLENGMATQSSILAWRIPRTEEPGGLQFMGLHRVGHDWATNIHTHTRTHSIYQALFLTTAAPTKCEMESRLNFHCPSPVNSTLAVLLLFDWVYWRWESSETGQAFTTYLPQRAFSLQSFTATPLYQLLTVDKTENPPPHCNPFFFSTLCLSLPLIWEHNIFLPFIGISVVLI